MAIFGTTPNFNFRLIAFNTAPYQDDDYANWRALDGLLNSIIQLSNFKGVWENSTSFTAGERVIDDVDGSAWQCDTDHTSSASPTTFATDRSNNPSWWSAFGASAFNEQSDRSAREARRSSYLATTAVFTATNEANSAATSASNASTSESNASTSETNAATSASNASTSETNAAASESNASTSETNAATSEINAATSATSANLNARQVRQAAGVARSVGFAALNAQSVIMQIDVRVISNERKSRMWKQIVQAAGANALNYSQDAAASATSASAAQTAAEAAQTAAEAAQQTLEGINTQTGTSYTLLLADAGRVVEMNNGSANTLTVPNNSTAAFPVASVIEVVQYGAGATTIAAAGGVTIRSAGGVLGLRAQYSGATLYKRATNEWVLVGDIE